MTTEDKFLIEDIFQKVVSHLSCYEPRPQQITMAEEIDKAFLKNKSLIIEAGTGSGKSFGYLIPAALSGKKIVISTGTIALQEQLLNKDIPFVVSHCNDELKYTLAKGRRNYLCRQKYSDTQRVVSPSSREGRVINKIDKMLHKNWSGDLAELDFIVPDLLWAEINSDKDDCLNHRCDYFADCPFRLARAELADSDIIIANHALYFTDISGGGTVLPPHDFVIFDEAHHIKNIATKAFTVTIGKYASTKLMQKIQKRVGPIPDRITQNIATVETEILRWLFDKGKESFRIFAESEFFEMVQDEIYYLNQLRSWLNDLDIDQLDLFGEDSKLKKVSYKERLLAQANNLISRWEYFLVSEYENEEDMRVNWAETNQNKISFDLHSAPIFIAKILKEKLWEETPAILTSATLAINRNCNYTKLQLGIEADDLILDSPFEYEHQARLYLPKTNLIPNSYEYNAKISEIILELVTISEGRALVLFTSNMAMKNVSAAVIERVTYPCKVQGDLPRKKLIDWFKETNNSILFATATYWEGIDIPGEDLSLVIIDKIPFSVPDDPVVSATVDQMKAKNQGWFMDYMLPEATLRLKQGFGRLIRTRDDRGIISIIDPRLVSKAYGRIILNSLPKTLVTRDVEEIKSFFEEIKVSL
jgi:ATP-dependent DNA helicase DinG